VRGGSDTKT